MARVKLRCIIECPRLKSSCSIRKKVYSRTFEGKGSVFLKKEHQKQNKREKGKNEEKLTKHSIISYIFGKQFLLDVINVP